MSCWAGSLQLSQLRGVRVREKRTGCRALGFTLIELLVVVAIIALLIAILLPSLNRARAQARTALCLSRIAQFGKAFLMYADDYDGVFPFTATLHETRSQGPNTIENWLCDWGEYGSAEAQTAIEDVAYTSQDLWGDVAERVPRSGTLFTYAGFEQSYRCPDFERKPQAEQHVFNYTRALWGRQWRFYWEYPSLEDSPEMWGGVDGPILKVSKVHSPARLPLVLDEQWDRHVGTAGMDGDDSAYHAGDYGFFIHNIIAVAHGEPVTSEMHKFDFSQYDYAPYLWKRGSVACYDGHAQLLRDPWPTLPRPKEAHGPFRGDIQPWSRYFEEFAALAEFSLWVIYAQRGMDPREFGADPPVFN